MTREIIELPAYQGVSLDDIKSALASFPDCVVDQPEGEPEEILFIQCQAVDGWAIRERLESIRA
jgi:hypothetical protein